MYNLTFLLQVEDSGLKRDDMHPQEEAEHNLLGS